MLPPVIEKARKILLHEQRLGHSDQTVRPGGLEAFVAHWAEEVAALRASGKLPEADGAAPSTPTIEQVIQQLLQGYHALDPMQRAARVRAALARLGGAEDGPGHDSPAMASRSSQSSQIAAFPASPGFAGSASPATQTPPGDGRRPSQSSLSGRGGPGPASSAPPPTPSLPAPTPSLHASTPSAPAKARQMETARHGPSWDALPFDERSNDSALPPRPQKNLALPPTARYQGFTLAQEALPSGSGTGAEEKEVLEDTVGSTAVESHFLLKAQVTAVPGVGSAQEAKLQRLGIFTVQDLLFYFPREHHDYSKLERIGLIPLEQVVTIMGMIWEVENARSANGRVRTLARISDETGQIRAVWFNQPYLAKQLTRGSYIVLTGVKQRFGNRVEFQVRSHELPEQGDLVNTGRLVPVYALTEGLNPKALRRYTKWAVDRCADLLVEFLPAVIRSRVGLLSLPQAVGQYHYPENESRLLSARRRLAFDELFLIQLGMLARRAEWSSGVQGVALTIDSGLIFASNGYEQKGKLEHGPSLSSAHERSPHSGLWPVLLEQPFESALPFRFTGAQRRVISEILADLGQTKPMCRLLQGDVGSGKTVVAAAGLLTAAINGFQGVLMAPTEILAEQHHRTLMRLLEPLGIQVALLTGSQKQRERASALAAAESGEALVVVGTHALIQEGVTFARLGFAVVDEQHRFGVEQRDALRQKGYNPHMLVMTATPIPRTLALTLYGDLDISTLDEMPAGRQQIITRWRSGTRRAEAYRMIAEQVALARQAYVICPLIEESETLEVKAAVKEYERLRTQVFPMLRLGLVHGGLKSSEKEQVMRRFRDGELDVLVATAVVEVGVDVPNATVMVIEDADRFGISQLHQFRGRVGRGEHQSYCYVLSEGVGPQAQERLSIIERTTNGFQLAEEDLKLRGPGDFFGTRQSGLPELRVANLADTPLLEEARRQAEWLWSADPYLEKHEHHLLRERVAIFWNRFIGH